MKKYKEVWVCAVVLTAICVIISGTVAAVNALTEKTIAHNEMQTTLDLIAQAVPDVSDVQPYEGDIGGAAAVYTYQGGAAIVTETKGYGGTMSVLTCFSSDGKIAGVRILSDDETPGLGKKVYHESFIGQYIHKPSDGPLQVVKAGKGGADDAVEAITGATISSRAVTAAVNSAAEVFRGLSLV